MSSFIKKWDVFPKFTDDVRQKTSNGGLIAIFSIISMIFLFAIRFKVWSTSAPLQKFVVNTPELPFSTGRIIDPDHLPKMDINFDITTLHVPCSYLHVDVYDNIKESDESIESRVKMVRLDEKGNQINKKAYPKNNEIPPKPEGYCGSCYGMKAGCCNTCKEVRRAFKAKSKPLPPIATIQQCIDEGYLEELKAMANESCRIHGTLTVHRSPGTFHIAPGDCHEAGEGHTHYYENIGVDIANLNLSHVINHLSIGSTPEGSFNPLDKHVELQEKQGKMKMYYYLRIVPIGDDGKTFQFGASSYQNYRGQASKKYPGIYFSYDVSPIGVTTAPKESFMDLVTELMSILGGIFAIATFIDAMIFKCTPEQSLS